MFRESRSNDTDNPYESPSETGEEILKPLTEEQAMNRTALRGCLTTSVVVGGGLAMFLASMREIVEEADMKTLVPYFIAWIAAGVGCSVWHLMAAKKDRKRMQKNY